MVVEYHQFQTYNTILILTFNVTLTLVVMLAACICCTKKKVPKNELLGLEGMVKMKNPDDVIIVTTVRASDSQADLNSSTVSNADSDKRASTAAHRSLPDIPVADGNGDNGSELYETVADKRLTNAQNSTEKSPTPSLKKQISVSQHSSISQADDVSSPYSRVKNNPHDYAKLRSTEHPYAQLNAPATSTPAGASTSTQNLQISSSPNQLATHHETLNRNSHHSDTSSQTLHDVGQQQAEIPAASAIAGMISASQDLPYMTPPIGNQHFSGDSQDSSKGYTSISVREPLANILAQQPIKPMPTRSGKISRDTNDSHYATVSDDSDETYAAIEDPNSRMHPNVATDIYTSGSETYAQIQPMQPGGNSIVVSVEINNASSVSRNSDGPIASGSSQLLEVSVGSASVGNSSTSTIVNVANNSATSSTTGSQQTLDRGSRPSSEGHMQSMTSAHVDSLRAQMHSRQASCSSNNSSSMGNLGSPKPEKRQANSPLPPTPKSSTLPASSNSSVTSGRNSVISVIEAGAAILDMGTSTATMSAAAGASTSSTAGVSTSGVEISPQKLKTKSLSPSKDIEGMYAKVMKKNKFSRHSPSSQNSSPVMIRKHSNDHSSASSYLGVSPLDSAAAELMETHKITITTTTTNEKGGRLRSNSYNAKDHGYETIPADAMRHNAAASGDHRKSECYTSVLKKELDSVGGVLGKLSLISAQTSVHNDDEKYYETIAGGSSTNATITIASNQKTTLSLLNNTDPGYETFHKDQSDLDNEKKSSDYDPNYEVLKTNVAGLSDDGYAKVIEKKRLHIDEEDTTDGYSKVRGDEADDVGTAGGGYSTIREAATTKRGGAGDNGDLTADANHNYASILEAKGGVCETESDHYARINEGRVAPPAAPDALSLSMAASPLGETTLNSPTLPITSPSSINSASLFMSSSTPVSSSNMTTTTSASTMSSRPTPTSSSQYESLTGSDTDPNYESVCYLNTPSRENPYERLPTDYSDNHLSSRSSQSFTTTTDDDSGQPLQKAPNGTKANAIGTTEAALTAEVVVDDYFHV